MILCHCDKTPGITYSNKNGLILVTVSVGWIHCGRDLIHHRKRKSAHHGRDSTHDSRDSAHHGGMPAYDRGNSAHHGEVSACDRENLIYHGEKGKANRSGHIMESQEKKN